MSFLQLVAQDIQNAYAPKMLKKLVLILPNRRSSGVLKQYFSERKEAFVLPKFYTLQDFIIELSGLKPLSSLETLMLLYKSWTNHNKGHFESFLKWAPIFIKDMEDIHKTLLDPSEVLDELAVIGGIQQFSKGNSQKTEAFWKTLKTVYKDFLALSLKDDKASTGFIYKETLHKIEGYLKQTHYTHFLIGFNALSKAEEHIFKAILDAGKGEVYWDMDQHLLEKKFQKYGLFFNKYRKKWSYFKTNNPKELHDDYSKGKEMSILSGQGPIGQALEMEKLLGLENLWDTSKKTAIVLHDKKMLLPVVKTLEKKGIKANVTMGYPLSYTNVRDEQEHSGDPNRQNLMTQTYSFLNRLGIVATLEIVQYCYIEQLNRTTASFDTDHNASVQVMEILETRLLDFDTVIMTSVNEGVALPSNKYNSLISFKDRIRLGLPTYLDQEAIYTYHFYRLLHRAKQVYLIYDHAEGVEAKEKSRLILQIEQDKDTKHRISYNFRASKPQKQVVQKPLVIYKTPDCLKSLDELATVRGVSPTALTTYFSDPITFYERYILKVSKQETLDPLAPNFLGTAIHELLYDQYLPFVGTTLSVETISSIKKELPKVVQQYFERKTEDKNIGGKMYMALKIVENYMARFLDYEMDYLKKTKEPITLIALEKTYKTTLALPSLDKTVCLSGNIDRVDQVGDQVRIIDYKTGQLPASKVLKVSDVALLKQEAYFKHFQLLFYSFTYLSNHPELDSIQSGLFFLRNSKKGYHYLENNFDKSTIINQDFLKPFQRFLQLIVEEILDPQTPFTIANTA